MDLKLENSDISVSDWGEYRFAEGIDEVLQRLSISARVPKGAFVYNKELGTELRKIDVNDSRALKTASVLINEVLIGVEGAKADVTELSANGDGSFKMAVTLSYMGEIRETEVTLGADI